MKKGEVWQSKSNYFGVSQIKLHEYAGNDEWWVELLATEDWSLEDWTLLGDCWYDEDTGIDTETWDADFIYEEYVRVSG
jgi:hypothetical protein